MSKGRSSDLALLSHIPNQSQKRTNGWMCHWSRLWIVNRGDSWPTSTSVDNGRRVFDHGMGSSRGKYSDSRSLPESQNLARWGGNEWGPSVVLFVSNYRAEDPNPVLQRACVMNKKVCLRNSKQKIQNQYKVILKIKSICWDIVRRSKPKFNNNSAVTNIFHEGGKKINWLFWSVAEYDNCIYKWQNDLH